MKNKITNWLASLEEERAIKILLACETGSRAWGFPSPDSDFDVRLIYVHRPEWYLQLYEQKDSLEAMYEEGEIDISGWDLRKSLRLLAKSNAPLLERLQSPIIYRADISFLKDFRALAPAFYSRIAAIHHYLGLAKKSFAAIQEEAYNLKKMFYALRAATACKWILEKEELPPIAFMQMLKAVSSATHLQKDIENLIALKASKSEVYLHSGQPGIFSFIAECIQEAEAHGQALPAAKGGVAELNAFFVQTVEQQWTSTI